MSLPAIERKAVLALQPYFSKYPVVFDVGSNKGEWADTLIHNVTEMHLFEPNGRLLTYTQVKYDYLKNVVYNPLAVFSQGGIREFFYFINENNGLSSVYYNKHWVDLGLPMLKGKCQTIRLDKYCDLEIDFLKIDVEGADYDVILGAENLLKQRKIKFIQVEHSDHIILSGHKFSDIVEFVSQFGYGMFHFNGESFEHYTDQQAENFYIMDKKFTQDWNYLFKQNTKGIKVDFALEIGAFEGLTTNYICDEMLNPGGRVICIDPLQDQYLTENLRYEDNQMNEELKDMFKGQHERFIRNTTGRPVELLRMTSRKAFREPGFNDYRFGFIYIDGDHRRAEVYHDGIEAFHVCLPGGYILFDDYKWREETTAGIDEFLQVMSGYYELVIKEYQVMIKKTKNVN